MNPGFIVVLDAMGVIYQPGADVDDIVIPFLRERECIESDAEIIRLYNVASRGLLATRELWERLRVAGDPGLLDLEVVSRYSLTSGLTDFLRWCDGAGIPVACISNDISEWAALRAGHFGLSGVIGSWTISGDVGHRKPDGAIYDAFLAAVPVDATLLFVDDRLDNLTAAVAKGMRCVLFGPDSGNAPPGIASAAGFSPLMRLVAGMSEAHGK